MPITPLDAYADAFAMGFVAFYRQTLDPPTRSSAALRRRASALSALDGPDDPQRIGVQSDRAERRRPGVRRRRHAGDLLHDWREPDRDRIGRFVRLPFPQHPRRRAQPLARFTLTHLHGGGSVLGVGLSHALGDGTAVARFLGDWARCARGQPVLGPMWDRVELSETLHREDFDPATVPLDARAYLGLQEFSPINFARVFGLLVAKSPWLRAHTIRLHAEDLDGLKRRVASTTITGSNERVSSNDALAAFLWKLWNSVREPSATARSRFFGIADLRKHTPNVPEQGVFACMSGHLLLEQTTQHTADTDLRDLALRIRRLTAAIEPDHFHRQAVWLRKRQANGSLFRVVGAQPCAGDFAINNCRFLPFYDADFGGGRPYFVNMPAEGFSRIVVWPAPDGDGCVLNLHLTSATAKTVLPVLSRRTPLAS